MPNANTRDAILEAAARLYAERGYEAVSMRDVAAAVGVTPANLYYHFKDKEALIREVLAVVFGRVGDAAETVLTETGGGAETRLRGFVAWFVRLLYDDPIFARLLIRELLDGNPERTEYLARRVFDRPFVLLGGIVATLRRAEDPVLPAVSVAAAILGHYQMAKSLPYLPGGRPAHAEPEALTRHLQDFLTRAFAPDVRNGGIA